MLMWHDISILVVKKSRGKSGCNAAEDECVCVCVCVSRQRERALKTEMETKCILTKNTSKHKTSNTTKLQCVGLYTN